MYTYIQACRALAALFVVTFHLGGALAAEKYFDMPVFAQLTTFGSSGVEFFFVLSGFIITLVHGSDVDRPARLSNFAWRRGKRIYPAYWIIFCAVGAAAFVGSFGGSLPKNILVFVKSILLLPQDPAVVGGTGAPILIVAWSMQYELVFYAAFALFILSRRLGIAVLSGLCLWWVAGEWLQGVPFMPLHFMKPHHFAIFLLGVLAAKTLDARTIQWPVAWIIAGLSLYAMLASYEVAHMILNDLRLAVDRPGMISLAYGTASAILVCGLIAVERTGSGPAPRPLILLGDASYVLYLLHYPLISALCKIATKHGTGSAAWACISFVVALVLCCGVAVVFHLWIEKPILRWGSPGRREK